jgi:hypothetical protein
MARALLARTLKLSIIRGRKLYAEGASSRLWSCASPALLLIVIVLSFMLLEVVSTL